MPLVTELGTGRSGADERLKSALQTSPADAAHGAVRLHEVFFADVMAIFFLKDDFGEVLAEILVIGAGA